jgi:flagellar protein FlgJ
MTLAPINSLTPDVRTSDAVNGPSPSAPEPTPEQRKVAREFEAIFMRQLLGSMEKSSGMNQSTSNNGAAMYRSMMVGALADNAAAAGGIGLAEMILKAMLPASPAARVANTAQTQTSLQPAADGSAALLSLEPGAGLPLVEPPSGAEGRSARAPADLSPPGAGLLNLVSQRNEP